MNLFKPLGISLLMWWLCPWLVDLVLLKCMMQFDLMIYMHFFVTGSNFHLVQRRLFRVIVGRWLGKLQVVGEQRSLFLKLVMLITNLGWRGIAGPRCVVLLWTQLSIPMEEVITSTLDTQVLSGVMLLLARRLVSLLPREPVVSGDKLLLLLLRLIRHKGAWRKDC